NGLALYLGIPINETAALRRINRFDVQAVDAGIINDRPFFNVAGLGFDASVSDRFANDTQRVPVGYLRSVINVLANYKTSKNTHRNDAETQEHEAFIISVANSPHFGNNAYIAPHASVNDGILDVCIVKKSPLYFLPMMVFHLFNRSLYQSEYVEIIPGKEIFIERKDSGPVHVDGEPLSMEGNLSVSVKPNSLKIIC